MNNNPFLSFSPINLTEKPAKSNAQRQAEYRLRNKALGRESFTFFINKKNLNVIKEKMKQEGKYKDDCINELIEENEKLQQKLIDLNHKYIDSMIQEAKKHEELIAKLQKLELQLDKEKNSEYTQTWTFSKEDLQEQAKLIEKTTKDNMILKEVNKQLTKELKLEKNKNVSDLKLIRKLKEKNNLLPIPD